jgi:spore coat polysaccharide biosynthesis protein SpsF
LTYIQNTKNTVRHQNFCAIIQARSDSKRFPQKTMKIIKNHPMLYYLLKQVLHCKKISKVIVATTTLPEDDEIEDFAHSMNVDVFRGDVNDVLDRYFKCAKKFAISNVVRLTADNPLIDPLIIDNCIKKFENGTYDYVSNTINNDLDFWKYSQNGFPNGFSVEVFTFKTLKKAWSLSKNILEREHVTSYITKNPKLFRLGNIKNSSDFSTIRLTVDYEKDFQIVKKIIENLPVDSIFKMNDVINYLKSNSDLFKCNIVESDKIGYYGKIDQ